MKSIVYVLPETKFRTFVRIFVLIIPAFFDICLSYFVEFLKKVFDNGRQKAICSVFIFRKD